MYIQLQNLHQPILFLIQTLSSLFLSMAICLKIELQTKQVSTKHKYVCANGKAGRYFCPFIIQPMSTYSILK